MTIYCNLPKENTGPPAEVKLYKAHDANHLKRTNGSKYKAHDANHLKRTKEMHEKTKNHYANVTAASSSQLFSHERCSNNEKRCSNNEKFLKCHQKYSNF